jgi:branched-chain amino acid aminotransferase
MITPFSLHSSTALFRDEFVPFAEAHVSIASSPVLYGLAVYTVFNVIWDAEEKQLRMFRLVDHWRRLCNSARIMGFADFAASHPYERFAMQMLELLKKNNVEENVLVRASIFVDELIAGTRIAGLKNSFSAYVYPMGQFYKKEGVHVCVSSWRHVEDDAIPARAKVNGLYVSNSLMKNEALLNGFDEAICLDRDGHVTEGTVANIFMVRRGVLVTPDVSTDILEGITRDTIVRLAKHLDIPLEVRPVDRSELYIADELFFCGSSARITPIVSVDKRPVGDGKAGVVTSQLLSQYEAMQQGKIETFADFVTTIAN